MKIWKVRHSVAMEMNSAKVVMKGGRMLNSVLGVLGFYQTYKDIRMSDSVYVPYYMQDEGGVFSIRYSGGLFKKTKYYKTYVSGPYEGIEIEIDKEEFNFWKAEGQALCGNN